MCADQADNLTTKTDIPRALRGVLLSRAQARKDVCFFAASFPFGWDGSDELNPYGRTCMGKSAFHDRIIYNTSSRFFVCVLLLLCSADNFHSIIRAVCECNFVGYSSLE